MYNKFPVRFVFSCSENRQSKIVNLKGLGLSVTVFVLLVVGAVTHAQQPTKTPRVAFLGTASAYLVADRVDAFRKGLRELGYLDGQNILLEYRFGEGKSDEVTSLAMELARSKVDVIVTAGPAAIRSAKQATATIPIVMGNEGDRVGFCCEPCPTWRKYHWTLSSFSRDKRQTAGDSERDRS
jgi:ABC-type uncharacterized transport system substrate-binding protein